MGFFSWKKIIKKYPQLKKTKLWVISAPRNIGKSTNTYEFLKFKNAFTPENKVLLLRNTEQEMKMMRRDFNDRFKNEFIIKGNSIYNLKKVVIKDSNGDDLNTYKTNELIGYIASISTYTTNKSVQADKIKWIFYEEFNENSQHGLNIYPKFINIITTFIRFSDTTIIMLGNKDGFETDYHVNWDILPNDDFYNNYVFEIKGTNDKLLGLWLELGEKDFKDLKNDETLFYELALKDNRTANYIKGGYSKEINKQVVNYKNLLKSAIPLYIFVINETYYFFCKFNNQFCIISGWNAPESFKTLKLNYYSIDLISRLINGSAIIDDDEKSEIIEFLLKAIKNQMLLFDSYDTLHIFKDLTVWLKKLN